MSPSKRIDPPTTNTQAGMASPKKDEEEEDPWDTRIKKTGCADENAKLNECFYQTRDWRKCKDEMDAFKKCWAMKGNSERTDEK